MNKQKSVVSPSSESKERRPRTPAQIAAAIRLAQMGRGRKRADGLDPRSYAARKLRGKAPVVLQLAPETAELFRHFARFAGMNQNDALLFLLNGRPELKMFLEATRDDKDPTE